MLDMYPLNNTAYETGISPFFTNGAGGVVFTNLTDGSLIVQGAPTEAGSWTTYVTVPANGKIEGTADLPKWLRVSTAATVYMEA